MNSDSELIKALEQLIVTPDPITEYRFYYDDQGNIVQCMMQGPWPDAENFVIVTKEEYELYHRYKVVKGKVELIKHDIGYRVPFVQSNKGFRVVKNHAALLVQDNEEYNDVGYYELRNN